MQPTPVPTKAQLQQTLQFHKQMEAMIESNYKELRAAYELAKQAADEACSACYNASDRLDAARQRSQASAKALQLAEDE